MVFKAFGGDKRDRTADLLNAIQALSQLSYTPIFCCPSADDSINIPHICANVKHYFRIFSHFFKKGSAEYADPLSTIIFNYLLIRFLASMQDFTTIPDRATRPITLGMTMMLLNISVSSQTRSFCSSVPRKMNTRAITV